MSIQWTFIAGYLYFEIAFVMLMLLPIFSPRKWHKFFHSRLFFMFQERTTVYFYGLLGILCMFLIDSIREMRKYSHSTEGQTHLANEMKGNVKLFRAQRNFYITGFAIFLAYVIRRIITMILIQHELQVKADQIIKKAEETVKLAKTTVLENNLESQDYEEIKNRLDTTESIVEEQKIRIKELEEDATKWRLKYEEVNRAAEGCGDN
ncbi:unnamed protein product [Danaus chrysippus]|uniref:Endoplasmic reticulum transmembrane protein n=1 Tax=Danaus chrysippus TaxID=151541 RepID=A0A8J2VU46_9NEOP|nr:unnamed protein product [Danaus chrysippus]